MTEEISVSYSLDSGTKNTFADKRAAETSAEPLVAFADCELIPIDAQMVLVINRENGNQQLVSTRVVEALKTCVTFQTLTEHASRLCDTAPGFSGQQINVRNTLQQLFESGLLLQADTIKARLLEERPESLAETRVFIITCDRPDQLSRLLESMLRTKDLTSYESLWVIDDSKLAENREANAAHVDQFNTTSAATMEYFGEAEQAAQLNQLLSSFPEHEEGIRFLIDPARWEGKPTYGRARTLALLKSVGRRLIVLDDDVLCQAVRPAVPEEDFFVGSNGHREASFFSDRESLLAAAALHEESPLALHREYLGRRLGNTITSLCSGVFPDDALQGANAAMSNVWTADSKILVTQCGSWGDPGTGNAHWIMNLSEHSVSRLLTANRGMAAAVEDRNVWLGAPRPTIMKIAFMSQMTGLDNTELLPPYFTAFRGEDLLFASVVEALHPKGAVLECGFAVPHLPEQRTRKTLKDPIANAGSVALFAGYLTNNIDYTDANSAEDRMLMIAADLRRLASKSDNDLLLDYRREVAMGHARMLSTISKQKSRMSDFDSANWQGYLDRARSEMQGALQRRWGPEDIDGVPANMPIEEILAGFRSMLNGFAAGLEAWPALRQHVAL